MRIMLQNDANEGSSSDDFVDLFQELGYEGTESWESPQDSTDPCYQVMTESEIVAEVRDDSDSKSDDNIKPQPTKLI